MEFWESSYVILWNFLYASQVLLPTIQGGGSDLAILDNYIQTFVQPAVLIYACLWFLFNWVFDWLS